MIFTSPFKWGGAPVIRGGGVIRSVEPTIDFASIQSLENRIEDLLRPFQSIVVPESEDAKACRSQERITTVVIGLTIDMLAAVQLDDQGGFNAGKIANVETYAMLPPELGASEPTATQVSPEMALSVGRISSQVAGVTKHQRMLIILLGENMIRLLL